MSLKLTDSQKNRLKILEPQLNKAILEKDLHTAKFIMRDIQEVLGITNNKTKLAQFKNRLFELALETKDYQFAINGFIGNRKIVNKNTRIYLEATALLAICYLRTEKYEEAKPLIQEVLKNDKVIKSERTRLQFKKGIIERFDEEVALYSLKNQSSNEKFDIDELESEAIKLIQTKTEDEIFENMGYQTPQFTKHLMFEIDNFAKNQLSYTERKLLPSPEETIKDKQAGKTVFSSFKRVIYNSICDPKSEVYKAWCTNGLGAVLDKKYLITAVAGALAEMSICVKGLIVSAIALVIRFGLDIYCEHYKPKGVLDIRKE